MGEEIRQIHSLGCGKDSERAMWRIAGEADKTGSAPEGWR